MGQHGELSFASDYYKEKKFNTSPIFIRVKLIGIWMAHTVVKFVLYSIVVAVNDRQFNKGRR